MARASDLVVSVPEWHTGVLRDGLHSFALPIATPPIAVSLLWHPRHEADAVHRWQRELVVDTFTPIRQQGLDDVPGSPRRKR